MGISVVDGATLRELKDALPLLVERIDETIGREEALRILREGMSHPWPVEYVHAERGKGYKVHHEGERWFVYSDVPRYPAALGGEGGGKSVAGIVKALDRVRRGMDGIMVSPNLPHFKRSLWPEFRRWCPWRRVHERHQHRADPGWEPYQPFSLVFHSPYGPVTLYCGGIDEPMAWEGPNVSFAFFDEARRKDDPQALKVLDGRVRIPGPNGEPPQLFLTTTPRMNWLHDYYGPLRVRCEGCQEDVEIDIQRGEKMICPLCQSRDLSCSDVKMTFKQDSFITILLTEDNEENLEDGFAVKRAQSLTAAEARVLLRAEWEDIEEGQPFLPSMIWWDECKELIPDLTLREPMVLAADAATGRAAGQADYFALLGVTRHPERRADSIATRYIKAWQPRPGQKLDFQGTEYNPGPEMEIRRLCQAHNVAEFTYDPTQLHDMATRLRRERVVTTKEFSQMSKRSEADTDLYRLIQERRIAHDGNQLLREHVRNADRKVDPIGRRMRMVKRTDQQKIDLAIALSMAAYRCLYLQLV